MVPSRQKALKEGWETVHVHVSVGKGRKKKQRETIKLSLSGITLLTELRT